MQEIIWPLIAALVTGLITLTPWGKWLAPLLKPGQKFDPASIEKLIADLLQQKLPVPVPTPAVHVVPVDPPDTFVDKILALLKERLRPSLAVPAAKFSEAIEDAGTAHVALHKLQDIVVEVYEHGDSETAAQLQALMPQVSAACCRPLAVPALK